MRIRSSLLVLATLALSGHELQAAPAVSDVVIYDELCEPSALANLGNGYFAIGSDETNWLHVYRRGSPAAITTVKVTTYDKSDIEDAAVIEDRVYWISSHSPSTKGKDGKRKVLFATSIVDGAKGPTLQPVAYVYEKLRKDLASAFGIDDERSIDIEGLAAAPDGGLLIGLRAPLSSESRARVVHLANPAAIVDSPDGSVDPVLDRVFLLDLGGLGVRGMTQLDDGFLIIAGPDQKGAADSRLYTWKGGDDAPVPVPVSVAGLNPEAAIVLQGSSVMLVSDDGDYLKVDGKKCDDEDTPIAKRHFRAVDVQIE